MICYIETFEMQSSGSGRRIAHLMTNVMAKGKKDLFYFRLIVSVDISPLLHTETIDPQKGPQPIPETVVNMSFLPGLGSPMP